jgi:hypothetical protein
MTGQTVQAMFVDHRGLTLRKLAYAYRCNYNTILRKARQPLVGVAYKRSCINFDAVADYLTRVGADSVVVDWSDVLRPRIQDRRPALIQTLDDLVVGDRIWIRDSNVHPYIVEYKTESVVCLRRDKSDDLVIWNLTTLLSHGPSRARRKGGDE